MRNLMGLMQTSFMHLGNNALASIQRKCIFNTCSFLYVSQEYIVHTINLAFLSICSEVNFARAMVRFLLIH